MKKSFFIIFAILIVFAFSSCFENPHAGWYAISDDTTLKAFLKNELNSEFAYLTSNNITISEPIGVPQGVEKTLDLNGKSLILNDFISNEGSLTLINGKIEASDSDEFIYSYIRNKSKLELEEVEFEVESTKESTDSLLHSAAITNRGELYICNSLIDVMAEKVRAHAILCYDEAGNSSSVKTTVKYSYLKAETKSTDANLGKAYTVCFADGGKHTLTSCNIITVANTDATTVGVFAERNSEVTVEDCNILVENKAEKVIKSSVYGARASKSGHLIFNGFNKIEVTSAGTSTYGVKVFLDFDTTWQESDNHDLPSVKYIPNTLSITVSAAGSTREDLNIVFELKKV